MTQQICDCSHNVFAELDFISIQYYKKSVWIERMELESEEAAYYRKALDSLNFDMIYCRFKHSLYSEMDFITVIQLQYNTHSKATEHFDSELE